MLCSICQNDHESLIQLKNHVTFGDQQVCPDCLLKNDYGMLCEGLDPGMFVIEDKYITNSYKSFVLPVTHIENKRFKFQIPELPEYQIFFVKGKFNNVTRFRLSLKA